MHGIYRYGDSVDQAVFNQADRARRHISRRSRILTASRLWQYETCENATLAKRRLAEQRTRAVRHCLQNTATGWLGCLNTLVRLANARANRNHDVYAGVYTGGSMSGMAKRLKGFGHLWGFDSFTGLPRDDGIGVKASTGTLVLPAADARLVGLGHCSRAISVHMRIRR